MLHCPVIHVTFHTSEACNWIWTTVLKKSLPSLIIVCWCSWLPILLHCTTLTRHTVIWVYNSTRWVLVRLRKTGEAIPLNWHQSFGGYVATTLYSQIVTYRTLVEGLSLERLMFYKDHLILPTLWSFAHLHLAKVKSNIMQSSCLNIPLFIFYGTVCQRRNTAFYSMKNYIVIIFSDHYTALTCSIAGYCSNVFFKDMYTSGSQNENKVFEGEIHLGANTLIEAQTSKSKYEYINYITALSV